MDRNGLNSHLRMDIAYNGGTVPSVPARL